MNTVGTHDHMLLPTQTSKTERENEPGLLLGFASIAILAVLLILSLSAGFPSGRFGQDQGAVLMGLYLLAWGVIFLTSYFYSHKSFFFRGLIWVCERLSSPRGRKMALFYFALAFIGGGFVLLTGLGVIR